jgi:23S rRNA pseudouridine1911/1915/1917 synthase
MPQTLLDLLIRRFPNAKKQTLRRMVEQRRVRVDGKPALSVKQPIDENQKIIIDDRPKPVGPESIPPPFPIVFEDPDLLIIDKPAGLLTSTVPHERRPTALALARDYVGHHDPRPRAGLIHRLDRDASGLLVFSKNHEAFRSLKEQFFKHTVERIYTAVVHGRLNPARGRIHTRLVELTDGSVRSTKRPDHGEDAISEYQVIRTAGKLSLVRVTLHTGRKHQIRVHLSERGAAILGDSVYAPKDVPQAPRLLLMASELSLDHPRSGERMHFKLKLIPEIRRLFR